MGGDRARIVGSRIQVKGISSIRGTHRASEGDRTEKRLKKEKNSKITTLRMRIH